MIVAEKNRLLMAPEVVAMRIRDHVKWLEKELSYIDGEFDEAVQESETWRRNEGLLRSVPGVGPVLARTLLAELPELVGVLAPNASRLWWGSPPFKTVTPVVRCAASGRCGAGGHRSERLCIWAPSSPPATTQSSKSSTAASWRRASPRSRWRWWGARGSC